MICLSPACIVPFWSGFISESLHPFLVSIVSSLFSILPIWKYLLDPTEQITLLSCFLMCQTVVLCTYFTNHPSWICEVIAAFLVTVSPLDSMLSVCCLSFRTADPYFSPSWLLVCGYQIHILPFSFSSCFFPLSIFIGCTPISTSFYC